MYNISSNVFSTIKINTRNIFAAMFKNLFMIYNTFRIININYFCWHFQVFMTIFDSVFDYFFEDEQIVCIIIYTKNVLETS